jgi:hypothetical protein
MSRINKAPLGFSNSGRSKARIVTIVAGAALFGTVVGGASAVGVVMAIVQPPAHDVRADAGSGGAAASFDAPAQPQQAQAVPPSDRAVTATASAPNPPTVPMAPQPEQAATTQQPAPSKTWPDALSARTDHGRAASPTPPEAATAARDLSGSRQDDEHTARDNDAPPASEPTVAERAPWPNPVPAGVKAMRKRSVVASEPVPPVPQPTTAQPTTAQSTPPSVAADDTNTAPPNKTRDDVRKPRLTQQQQPPQSRDAMDQSRDGRETAAYPPRQRVIILAPPPPPPERDAGMDRDHQGNGLFGLFDFVGHDHWNDDHWGNDRWHDQHD